MPAAHAFRTVSLFALLCLALPAGASAKVWTVGPGGDFTQIQAAVNAASDGDIILVKSGSYGSVLIDHKGVQVAADTGAPVTVNNGVRVLNLDGDQTVVLIGLKQTKPNHQDGLYMLNNEGAVRVEDCQFIGSAGDNEYGAPGYHPDGWCGIRIQDCADVALVRCTAKGGAGADVWDWWIWYPCGQGNSGLFNRNSTVALYDCQLTGGNGGSCYDVHEYSGGGGGSGYESPDGFLFASGSAFAGGDGGFGGDSNFYQGGNGGNGGHGVYLNGLPVVEARLLDNTYQSGKGGQPGYGVYPGNPGVDGSGIKVITGSANLLTGTAHTFQMPSPVREKESVNLTFTGLPGDQTVVFLSLGPNTVFSNYLRGQWLLAFSPLLLKVGFGTIPGSGTLSVPVTLPAQGPGFDAMTVHLQSIFSDGAGVTMGSFRTLVVLDETY